MATKPRKSPAKAKGTTSRRRKTKDAGEPEVAVQPVEATSAEAEAKPAKSRKRKPATAKKPSAATKAEAADVTGTAPKPKPRRKRAAKPKAESETAPPVTGKSRTKTDSSPGKKAAGKTASKKTAEMAAKTDQSDVIKPATRKKPATRSTKGKVSTTTRKAPSVTVEVRQPAAKSVTVKQRSNLYTQRIDQIGAAYSMIEDRVLINVSRKDRSGVKMWLTRRATNHLWLAMMKVIERRPEVAAQQSPVSKKAVMEFQQSNAVQTNNPKKPFKQDDLMYPHGEDPLVVHSFTCGPDPEGLLQVTLRFGKERDFVTSMDLRMVYLFCDLLANSAKKMDWGLDLSTEKARASDVGAPVTTPKPVVH
tara:strand:+ start:4303 stop:5391 length:1089 start_codon:yes stop_codon:yes gene_type:complete